MVQAKQAALNWPPNKDGLPQHRNSEAQAWSISTCQLSTRTHQQCSELCT